MRGIGILAAAAMAVIFTAAPAHAEKLLYVANLTAAEEVPNPGPEGAVGTARVNIDTADNQVCYQLSPGGLSESPSAAHIHQGAKGVAGPVVIDFMLPANGLENCITGDAAKVAAVVADPGAHYVNIHTPSFQAGAMRGQLALLGNQAPPQPTPPVAQPAAQDTLPRTGIEWTLIAVGLGLVGAGTAARVKARRR